MEALSLEIEREKFEYLEKSKHLQDQLQTFKSEIDDLKLDEKVTELDKIHSQQRNEGENKYSTIQKVIKGSKLLSFICSCFMLGEKRLHIIQSCFL